MATIARQPFAPLDGTRLQNLTSLKNRQNAISPATGKRKVADVDTDDFENVDPVLFSKRSKGDGSTGFPTKEILKPSAFVLTKAASSTPISRPIATPRSRSLIQAKSPAGKLGLSISVAASPSSAPAGRSPTRGSKRAGILSNRRRTASPYTRVEPPSFSLSGSVSGSSAPFSLDACLKGTLPGYAARSDAAAAVVSAATPALASTSKAAFSTLKESEMKASWFFDIHEDTPEQEMTNLLQHGTCVLYISSDEESERRASRERAEGRDKENVPPTDDVSQTSARRSARLGPVNEDDMVVEKERVALGEMRAADFYAAGCDETSVILVPGDDDEEEPAAEEGVLLAEEPLSTTLELATLVAFGPEAEEVPLEPLLDVPTDVDTLMSKDEGPALKAAVLEPLEGTGESFELWESGSAKDDGEAMSPATPAEEAR